MRLAHGVEGAESGPVLVLSSSLGTTRDLWAPQLPALVPHFRLVRYDHPGHGESPPPDKPITVEDLALEVVELLDFLEIEQASFCGVSLGGAVGMALALHAPDRVDRLVLACTSARFGEPAMWHDRAGAVRAGGTAAIAEAVLGRWFTSPFASDHPDAVARFRATLESVPSEGYAACCEALADWDARESARRIEASTLVIAGADDVATPPSDGEYLAASIPGARLAILDDAAHLANVEQPEAFDRVLLDHLAVPIGAEERA
jgi:3-oxoadipate enol-lactonase